MSKRLTKTIWYGSGVDSNGNPILPSNNGGLDGLNYGELYLHLSNGKATLWTLSSDGKIVEITGGADVDMSKYLLKSIWDKVFELKTDSQGIDYIFSKLPVVTQYGITMYSGDGIDIPSLASGLPFDGRTIWYNPDTNQIEVIGGTGGGSGEGVSNFWDLSGIPSWITISKPKYTYSEIEGTPDLSGFATQNWIISQGYASAEELKKYIPISGYTEVSGEKNFTGGLKVNGSPIYYDTEKKYWKLEGDLLVTGGVTMYGSDSSFTPSTIMDAIAVDGTTISKSGGVLKVIGGTGGGVADSVAWANITGKPTWIGSSKPTYSYSEITGAISTTELQNYLTQNSYINVIEGDNRYLKLSGGSMGGDITLPKNSAKATTYSIDFYDGTHKYLFAEGGVLKYGASTNINTIIHSGNYSNYALPLSGGVVKGVTTINGNIKTSAPLEIETPGMGYNGYIKFASSGTTSGYLGMGGIDKPVFRSSAAINYTLWHSGNDGADSGLDADLLDGKHLSDLKIWGQSFDGTGNVSGTLNLGESSIRWYDSNSYSISCPTTSVSARLQYHADDGHIFKTAANTDAITILRSGNVGIGTPNPTSKCDIYGLLTIRTESSTSKQSSLNLMNTSSDLWQLSARYGSSEGGHFNIYYYDGSTWANPISINKNGNLLATGGITTNDSVTINGIKLSKSKDGVLYLDGNLVVKGGVTMYGTNATSSPSIFDSLPVASTTTKGVAYFDSEFFSVGSDGKVSFIGKTDGFNATELQNYLTQNLYLNTTQGDNRYLKLSGGVIEGSSAEILSVNRTGGSNAYVSFRSDGSIIGYIGVSANQIPVFANRHGTATTIWHSGNDGVDSGLDADLLDGKEGSWYIRNVLNFQEVKGTNTSGGYDLNVLNYGLVKNYASSSYWANAPVGFGFGMVLNLKTSFSDSLLGQLAWDINHRGTDSTRYLYWRANDDMNFATAKWHQIAFTDSNVASATKLQTARTIWGKSFDGTGNVSGNLTLGYNKIYLVDGNNNYYVGWNSNSQLVINNLYDIIFSTSTETVRITSGGKVGIGTTSPSYKLHVDGTFRCNSIVTGGDSPVSLLNVNRITATTDYIHLFVTGGTNNARPLVLQNGYGNIGIGVAAPTHKLHVVGNTYLNGDVFADELNTYDVIPRTSVTYDLGNSSYKWNNVYASSMIAGYIHGGGNALYLGNSENTSYIYIREDMASSSDSWSIKLGGEATFGSLTSNGALTVTGDTTLNSTLTGNYWYLNNSASNPYLRLNRASSSSSYWYIQSVSGYISIGGAKSANSVRIDASGNILAAGGITMYSQRSLKNIQDERGLSLHELGAIKPIRYTWKDNRDNRLHIGGIADDIQQVLPEVVYKTNDGVLTMDYGNAAFAIASSLIKPVIDHEKRIAMLEEENKELRNEIERLKSA